MTKIQVDSNDKAIILNGKALIASEGGVTPTGSISITENGTYDVTNYAIANVNVPSGGGDVGIPRKVSSTGVYQIPTQSFTFKLPSNATDIGENAMYYAFRTCTGLTSVNLSSLTTISGSNAMSYAFYGCTRLTSVDLSSLTTINGSNAMHNAFSGCTGLTNISFPALTSTGFGSYTNQFNNMLRGVTGCTVHFPSNLQSVIGSWSGVTNGFGGTNTTVLFDLPATT